ncbi:hypothetical protein [Enterococcus sp. AZ196]|uniref:hypothetical protein n=1 Tax=Enterococcus sp. AZ196 TaxID=2774659 RepID=UPI003D27AEEA
MEQLYEWFSNNIDKSNQWVFKSLLACFILIVMTLTQLPFLEKLETDTKMSNQRKAATFLLTINLPAVVISLFIQIFSVIGFVYIIFVLVFDVMIIYTFMKHKLSKLRKGGKK